VVGPGRGRSARGGRPVRTKVAATGRACLAPAAQQGVQRDGPDRAFVRNSTTRRILASPTHAAGPARG